MRPDGHSSHLIPSTPGLQTHRPVICSQSDRTEPLTLQSQARKVWRAANRKRELEREKSVKEKAIAGMYD